MIEPFRAFIIAFETIWLITKTAVKFTSITFCQSSIFILNESVSFVIPALFTRMSKFPASAKADVITFASSSWFATSAQISWNFVLFSAAILSNSSRAALGFEHNPQTSAPSERYFSTIFLPIPRLEPVTSAFLFSNNAIFVLLIKIIL